MGASCTRIKIDPKVLPTPLPPAAQSRQSSYQVQVNNNNKGPSRSQTTVTVNGTNRKKLFLSYSSSLSYRVEDVRKMAAFLKQQKEFDVLFDVEKIQVVAEAINSADLFLVFFSETYPKEDSNTYELELALQKKKDMLMIRLQKECKPDDLFLSTVGNRLWVDFLDIANFQNDGEIVLKEIRSLLALQSNPQTSVPLPKMQDRFSPIKVPQFSKDYFNRLKDESRILKSLVETCRNPGKGALVIVGDIGVGKASLLSRILCNNSECDDNSPEIVEGSKVLLTPVFWLNCFRWRETEIIDDNAKKAFSDELVKLARQHDPSFDLIDFSTITAYFKQKHNTNVLFVFDDIFNASLLQFFLASQKDSLPVCCCAITREPNATDFSKQSLVDRVEKLEAINDAGIQGLFGQLYDMTGKLSGDRLEVLAKRCLGLPLVASLIFSRFKNKNSFEWNRIYVELIDQLGDDETGELPKEKVQLKTVETLFGLVFKELDKRHRYSYFAFLFFEPSEPVSEKDLVVLWRSDLQQTGEILKSLEACFLVQPVKNANKICYCVHSLLFNAALDAAAKELRLASATNEDRLQELRLKLLLGELRSEKKLIAIEVVRQQRRSLVKKIVLKLNGKNLARLSQQNDGGQNFLHFLYHFKWKNDVSYPEGHTLEKSGFNFSYRLLREILTKLLRTPGVDAFKVVNVAPAPTSDDPKLAEIGVISSFFMDLIEDESNKVQHYERRPLLVALFRWKVAHLENDWKRKLVSDENTHPLILAAAKGDVAEFEKVFSENSEELLESDEMSESVLAASRCNRLSILKFIGEKCGNHVFSAEDKDKSTAMILAARNGHLDVVRFLQEKDEELVSTQNTRGSTPLMFAASNGNLELCKFLYEKWNQGVSQQNDESWTPLLMAAQDGQLEIVKFILQKDFSTITQLDNDGWSALMVAAQYGHLAVVKFLSEKDPGKGVSLVDSDGWTALMLAAQNGQSDVVKFLCEKDAALVPLRNNEGSTAVSLAAQNGHFDVVRILFEKDNDCIKIKDNDSWTPLMFAVSNGHVEIAKFLCEKDRDSIALQDEEGWSSLMIAAQTGQLELVQYLYRRDKAGMTKTNSEGLTPMMVAAQTGNLHVVQFFKEQGHN